MNKQDLFEAWQQPGKQLYSFRKYLPGPNTESGTSQPYLDKLSFSPLFGAMKYASGKCFIKQVLLLWTNICLVRNQPLHDSMRIEIKIFAIYM